MATTVEKTKAPTGMTYSRNGSYHTVSWKIGDENYARGQKWGYSRPGFTYTDTEIQDIGIETTSKGVLISIYDLYPNTDQKMQWLEFAVAGKRARYYKQEGGKQVLKDPAWSVYSKHRITFNPPRAPVVSAQLDETLNNVTRFSWTVEVSDTNTFLYTDVQYQSMLVKETNETDGSKLTWKSSALGWTSGNTNNSNSYRDITEDTATLSNGSYTRWFRIRSRGAAGNSAWRYARHVYAVPKQAKISSAKASTTSAQGFSCKVVWKAGQSVSYPIDRVDVQYTIVVPDANVSCPNAATWTNAVTFADTPNNDAAVFTIDSALSEDQCLFIRVNTTHDRNTSYGVAYLAASGRLSAPDDLSVTVNAENHQALVSAVNNSAVPDSRLFVLYKHKSKKTNTYSDPIVIGVIPSGESSVLVQAPSWSSDSFVGFGVRAVVGSYTTKSRSGGVTVYTLTQKMKSTDVFSGGTVPTAPSNVNVKKTDTPGTIVVDWNWNWSAADSAVISWSDNPDAWESTDEPKTYDVSRLYVSDWKIAGLAVGKTWYVRVRLVNNTGDEATFGPWSDIKSIDLSEPPETPILSLSQGVITKKGSLVASWTYESADGSAQTMAEICQATVSGSTVVYGSVVQRTRTAYSMTMRAETRGWRQNRTYYLCCRVTSGSGKKSAWSDPVPVFIAPEVTAAFSASNLPYTNITDDDGETRRVRVLSTLPLTCTVTGAGDGGKTSVVIERAADYIMDRPDESQYNGYKGEVVAIYTQTGEASISINKKQLLTYLDDGATYNLVATVEDDYGQQATVSMEFEVHWDHQAVIPLATVQVIQDQFAVKLRPRKPEGWMSGDRVDIYRLSQDKPELILKDGLFNVDYVDPYPALGSQGGHRFVFMTQYGDYITATNQKAWLDLGENEGDILDINGSIIDFDGNHLVLNYGVDISNSWSKDFEETQYLGGSVQGDWNPAVSRSASVSVATIAVEEQDTINLLRRLAVYPGICHVRTFDGSSFSANIDVREDRSANKHNQIILFSLTIQRVDPEGYDAVKFDDWDTSEE